MGIATGTALAIGVGTSAAGSLASGIMGSQAAGAAGAAQTKAAQEGIQTIQQTASGYQPYAQIGTQGLSALSQAMGTPGQGLLTPWTQSFQAPTAQQAAATPGYQFTLQQGLNAIQSSAAASGGLLTGGTMKALNNYAQGVASTNYQQTYNNAFSNYLQNYQQFQQNQLNQYQRLMGTVGIGQQAQQGQMAAAGAQAQLYGNIGQATAGADIGQANALGGMFQSLGQLPLQYAYGQMGAQYLQNQANQNQNTAGNPFIGLTPSQLANPSTTTQPVTGSIPYLDQSSYLASNPTAALNTAPNLGAGLSTGVMP